MGCRTILVVDDDDDLRTGLRSLLIARGFDVVDASDADGAIRILDKSRVSVIITDFRMPRVDGIELMAKVKSLGHDIPIVMMSGYADKDVALQALRLQAFDFLEKPFKGDEIVKVVSNALERQQQSLRSRLRKLSLNQNQLSVVELLIEGKSNKEIAERINLSEQGVKYHIGNLLRRFELSSRTELRTKILKQLSEED